MHALPICSNCIGLVAFQPEGGLNENRGNFHEIHINPIAAGFAVFRCSASVAVSSPSSQDDLNRNDVARIAEFQHLRQTLGNTVWPGFGKAQIPFAMTKGDENIFSTILHHWMECFGSYSAISWNRSLSKGSYGATPGHDGGSCRRSADGDHAGQGNF